VTITLTQKEAFPEAPLPMGTSYRASITLRASKCSRSGGQPGHRCIELTGSLNGSAVDDLPKHVIADVPRRIRLSGASGHVHPLGTVSARGELTGTGFILRGHRTLTLTLVTRSGSVSLVGEGPRVPGFTPP
jgi:hypothetical protein